MIRTAKFAAFGLLYVVCCFVVFVKLLLILIISNRVQQYLCGIVFWIANLALVRCCLNHGKRLPVIKYVFVLEKNKFEIIIFRLTAIIQSSNQSYCIAGARNNEPTKYRRH